MKNKKKKIIIACLLGMVVCLGIGFAAFSTTLKINGSAKVSPDGENYKVFFVSSVNSLTRYDRGDFDGEANSDKVDPGKGHFEDDTTFTNTGVTFSEDGQSVDYKFYILNAGKYDAHITNLDIGNKTCTPGEDADPALAASACNSINLSVILGDEGNQTTYTSSQAIEDHILPKGTWEQIIVRISYPEGSPLADGDLEVTWEDISFLTATSATYTPPVPDLTKDPTYCFISAEPGVITDYREECSKDVVIPDDLELPLSTIKTKTFNINKCESSMIGNTPEDSEDYEDIVNEAEYSCDIIKKWYEDETFACGDCEDMINYYRTFDYEYEQTSDYYTVNKIANLAFEYKNIESIILSNNIEEIGISSFAGNHIKELVIPDSVSSIDEAAFLGNEISNLTIGSGLKTIDITVFERNLLNNIVIPDNVETIEMEAFYNNPIKTIEIGSGIKTLDRFCFGDNEGIESVKIHIPYSQKDEVYIHTPRWGDFDITNIEWIG